MTKAIDAEQYMELLKEQYLHNKFMNHGEAAKAWQGAIQLLYDMPTLTPPNEPLTCEGCYWQTHGSFEQCFGCFREKTDNYRRPPEGEEGDVNRG